MADLTTRYLGLTLRNPIVAGSSGLSNSVEGVLRLEEAGAGAVVLKSVFEEEISLEYQATMRDELRRGGSPEALDYFDRQIRGRSSTTIALSSRRARSAPPSRSLPA